MRIIDIILTENLTPLYFYKRGWNDGLFNLNDNSFRDTAANGSAQDKQNYKEYSRGFGYGVSSFNKFGTASASKFKYDLPNADTQRKSISRTVQNLQPNKPTRKKSGPNFKKSLFTILHRLYPTVDFNMMDDRVESADRKLTVIGDEMVGKLGRKKYVGIYLWDVATGPYTGALVPAIKQTTEQLMLLHPEAKPALFLGGDNENPEAWNHIANKLKYRIIDDKEENFEELN